MSLTAFRRTLRGDLRLRDALVYESSFPARAASEGSVDSPLPECIVRALRRQGIDALYSHQGESLRLARAGADLVVVTPTASGKSLCYVLPILERIAADPNASALVLFPLKALERDQLRKLQEWSELLGEELPFSVAVFDGDTPAKERAKIKRNPPSFLITNPDMLHQGMLAYHQSWESFLKKLRYIVIDELHAYRGVFGSHILQVLRRMSRLLHYYGSKPQYICLSATIGNPADFAKELIGRDLEVVAESGAPQAERDFILVNAREMSSTTTVLKLLTHALESGLKTIVFTKSRVATEVLYRSLTESRPDLARHVSSYRAGFLPEERRQIEAKLASGELRGVISTSALELGIDIGGLDCCILAGYPGSIMSLKQRAGRVGRRDEKSCVILVAGYDQLDQYFARQPEKLLDRPVERALINRDNDHILKQHLPAAASEIPLMTSDPYLAVLGLEGVLADLEANGSLVRSASGKQWFPGRARPHTRVDLRTAGSTFDIVDAVSEQGITIGTISGSSVFRECHEGAIYLHRGEQYHVENLNIQKREIRVRPYRGHVYTMVRSEKETEILDVRKARIVGSFVARVGMVRVTERYHAFERRRLYTQELLSVEPLDLPQQSFTTIACWIELPEFLCAALTRCDRHFMGSIHAIEHAVISLIPLHALCDRMDVGGISFTRHAQHENGAVFFYDGYPGGAGIADCVYDVLDQLLGETRDLISSCSCEDGCPSCVQSPKCGSGNKPLDKTGAVEALCLLLEQSEEALAIREVTKLAEAPQMPQWIPSELPTEKRIVVFDLETQKSAEEVGGWREARQMRVAIGAVWDSQTGETVAYDEEHIEDLIQHLKSADLVCGFNNRHFDYEVLRGYTFDNLQELPTLDLLEVVTASRGGRLKLDSLARATLKSPKSADGLQSIAWFKEGKIDLVREYCIHDVEITRDLLIHALRFGYLDYEDKTGAPLRLPVRINLADYIRERQLF